MLLAIDKAQVEKGVVRTVRRTRPGADVEPALAALVEMGLAIRDGDGYLGLPVFDRASIPETEATAARRPGLKLDLVSSS